MVVECWSSGEGSDIHLGAYKLLKAMRLESTPESSVAKETSEGQHWEPLLRLPQGMKWRWSIGGSWLPSLCVLTKWVPFFGEKPWMQGFYTYWTHPAQVKLQLPPLTSFVTADKIVLSQCLGFSIYKMEVIILSSQAYRFFMRIKWVEYLRVRPDIKRSP